MADSEANPAKKQKRTSTKRKGVRDGADAKTSGKSPAKFDVLAFEAYDANQLMSDVTARRHRNKYSKEAKLSIYPQLQLLSEWRLFQEIARQQIPTTAARGSSLSSLRGDAIDGSKKLLGFEPDLLDVLQLGATSHLRDIIIGAARVANQRRLGSLKQPGFAIVEDIRIGLGDIRKRDEDEAARIKEMENELTLKQAAHKSADEELREKAKNLKEQRAGEQAAAAANKALAATLGGGKWDKWGVGGSTLKTRPKTDDMMFEHGKDAGAGVGPGGAGSNAGASAGMNAGLNTGANVMRNQGHGGFVIEVGDIVSYLETQPEYANSPILFKLMNLKSMT